MRTREGEGSSPVRGGGCKDEGASDLGLLGARTITCVGSATFDNVFHIFCFLMLTRHKE